MKTVSEATVDLGHVVEAIKKIEEEGQGVSEEVKAEILKMKTCQHDFGRNRPYFNLNELEPEYYRGSGICSRKETETQETTSQSLEDLA